MTPQAALAAQPERHRQMSGEQRWDLAFECHELACAMGRAGVGHQHPEADVVAVEWLLRRRLALARDL